MCMCEREEGGKEGVGREREKGREGSREWQGERVRGRKRDKRRKENLNAENSLCILVTITATW